MDRNWIPAVLLLLFLVLSNFSDASLISSYRKFAVKEKDSVPGSPVAVSGDDKSDGKVVKEPNNGDSKSGLDKENQSSETDKKLGPNEVNQSDEDKKSNTKIESENANSGTEAVDKQTKEVKPEEKPEDKPIKEPIKEEKPVDKPIKDAPDSGEKQSDEKGKPGSELGNNKKPETKPVSEEIKEDPVPPVPKNLPVTKLPNGKSAENSPPPNVKSGKKEGTKENDQKKEEKSGAGTVSNDSCDGVSPSCTVQKDLIGCLKSSNDDSKVVVLVQNKGETDLKANVAAEKTSKELEYDIPKKQSKMISVPATGEKISSILLYNADGKCELLLHQSATKENYFRIPTYDKLVTPVNGAYFLILSAVIFGGTFTCIKFSRRKRQGGGIPYQELEMGIPESVSTADVESAEGWDEGWDDDWDDNDKSAKSTAARHARSISANGLTSRSPIKDGWEDNWDD